MSDIDKEDDRRPSGDESEVVFSQQEKVATALGVLWPGGGSTEGRRVVGGYGAL